MGKYDWDLEYLLQGKTLKQLHDETYQKLKELTDIVHTFCETYEKFKLYLKKYEGYNVLSNRFRNYCSNKINAGESNEEISQIWQKWKVESNELYQKYSNYDNYVIKNKNKIEQYLKNKELKDYIRSFDFTFKKKDHIISENDSKLLSKLSLVNSANNSVFSTLHKDSARYNYIFRNKKGKKFVTENYGDLAKLLKNKDRKLRKNAYLALQNRYNRLTSTFCKTLYYNYLKLNTMAKIYNYKNYIDRVCFNDEVDEKLITTLYQNSLQFKKLNITRSKLYKKALKKALGYKKIKSWDYSMSIYKKKMEFSIEDAQKIIIDSLSILGDDYVKNIKKAFSEKWISYLSKKGKRTGAYSIGGTKGIEKKYILMNFCNDFDSIETLIHELGHSMNSLYTCKNQKVNYDNPIILAEIPSIVNETILNLHMIENSKKKKKKNFFIHKTLSRFFNTVSNQIAYSNFEYEANEIINDKKPFTELEIKKLYAKNLNKYCHNIKLDKLYKKLKKQDHNSNWYSNILTVPHFYDGNFYVYKYALGQIVAVNVVYKLINNEKGFREKYLKFLGLGDSLPPIEAIKTLGVDMYDKKTYTNAYKFVKNLIDKL